MAMLIKYKSLMANFDNVWKWQIYSTIAYLLTTFGVENNLINHNTMSLIFCQHRIFDHYFSLQYSAVCY